jgi:hypothetical protein
MLLLLNPRIPDDDPSPGRGVGRDLAPGRGLEAGDGTRTIERSSMQD